MNDNLMLLLESRYRSRGVYEIVAIDAFIGKFFGMVACNNKAHNYLRFYERLERLDTKLFTLLKAFWDDWSTFDINNPEDDYHEMLEIHMEDLAVWCENKRFI